MTKDPLQYRRRTYRRRVNPPGLTGFRTVVQESDLYVHADGDLTRVARNAVLRHRGYIETYIAQQPGFATSLAPWPEDRWMPNIVRAMVAAGRAAGVGPMAAVAGAIAEAVGRDLLVQSREVIVENGGDLFIRMARPLTVAIFAGDSPLSMKIGLRIESGDCPRAVCTSSGRIGHSLSMGRAHAVCVVAADGALADATATAVGNRIVRGDDIPAALDFGRTISGIAGIVAVHEDRMGMWGDLELIPLTGKKG
ncbi:MAG: UPF0280 family protein [Desulfobacterales bacterium]|nr:UPF0280 family protein [Desulfobacterales bacterium]